MKSLKAQTLLIVLFTLTISPYSFAQTNSLICRDVSRLWSTKNAHITSALLIVEPHGAYIEQSLYLKYSDKGAFPGSDRVEIVHKFELPEGSVVNDMWLWIGDSIMQAILLDTWTARHMYDSIVYPPQVRDPALLTKKGNQYDLRIYPAGLERKVKLNFITPNKWYGNNAITELPLNFLKASASSTVPLTILFRTKAPVWGNPSILELPNLEFTMYKDTAGYSYRSLHLENIKNLSTLNLSLYTNFSNGLYFSNNIVKNDLNYFQFGIKPWEALGITTFDTVHSNTIIGLDLSGYNYRDFSTLISNFRYVIKGALRPADKFNILVAGAGEVKSLSPSMIQYSEQTFDSLINQFISSQLADSINKIKKPKIYYSELQAYRSWRWRNMSSYTNVVFNHNTILESYKEFKNYDNIFIKKVDSLEINAHNNITAAMDSVFDKGGKILQFSGSLYRCDSSIQKKYIPSFKIKGYVPPSWNRRRNLYKNPGGNFSEYLPDTLMVQQFMYLEDIYDDQTKVEMTDSLGRPVIISKRLGNNGYYMVNCADLLLTDTLEDYQKNLLFSGFFNLNNTAKGSLLTSLLNEYKNQCTSNNIDQIITFSNSDSLTSNITLTNEWVSNYLNSFQVSPKFINVNLVDGSIYDVMNGNLWHVPFVSINEERFHNSGYLLKKLSDETNGIYLERFYYPWDSIITKLSANNYKYIDSIKVTPVFQSVSDSLKEMWEVNIKRSDVDRPLFFYGSTNGQEQIQFNVDIKFAGIEDVKHGSFNFNFSTDTVNTAKIVPTMMGYEKLKYKLFNHPTDTASIVALGMKFNLLCDYTALLALEPNDTIHFMINPFDESRLPVEDDPNLIDSTYSLEQNYPNPFNPSTTLRYNIPKDSKVTLKIYDVLGNEVATLVDEYKSSGRYTAVFDGSRYASGVYICRLNAGGYTFTRKMLMMK